MKDKNKKEIIVVCRDAGGAEVVGAYVSKNIGRFKFTSFADGPAEKVFSRRKISFEKVSNDKQSAIGIFDRHANAGFLLSGTSAGGSPLERLFITEAKKRGIKTTVYLDHWVNYRERFGYPGKDWRKNLPAEIWVGDKEAEILAKRFFRIPIKFVKNLYFEEMKKGVEESSGRKGKRSILFLGEPPHGQRVLEKFLKVLTNNKKGFTITVRPHPSEKSEDYEEIFRKFAKMPVKISENRTLFEDIARSSIVVGVESMALVVALLVGRKAISFMPGIAGKCRLPFGSIEKIRTPIGLKNIIQ